MKTYEIDAQKLMSTTPENISIFLSNVKSMNENSFLIFILAMQHFGFAI